MDGNNLALKIEGAQVITATSSDEKHPASNIIDGEDNTFWMTSGMFPQAFVVSFPQAISVHRVTIHCKGVKQLKVLKCDNHLPVSFEEIVDQELDEKPDAVQEETSEFSDIKAKYLKFVIEKGFEDFASVYQVVCDGSM